MRTQTEPFKVFTLHDLIHFWYKYDGNVVFWVLIIHTKLVWISDVTYCCKDKHYNLYKTKVLAQHYKETIMSYWGKAHKSRHSHLFQKLTSPGFLFSSNIDGDVWSAWMWHLCVHVSLWPLRWNPLHTITRHMVMFDRLLTVLTWAIHNPSQHLSMMMVVSFARINSIYRHKI